MVKVSMIAQRHLKAGETVEAIAAQYGITLADVYAALAYYYDNRAFFEQHERTATLDRRRTALLRRT
jgi:uncharacterized protein (DUF433 family)